MKDVYGEKKGLVEKTTAFLEKINEILQPLNAHGGYRVRDEICFYLADNEDGELLTYEQALDHCILQKILPRIAGSDSRVKELLDLFTKKAISGDYHDVMQFIVTGEHVESTWLFDVETMD